MTETKQVAQLSQKTLENSKDWQKKYPTMVSQKEYFLLKFGKDSDISRDEVAKLMDQFQKFAKPNLGELEEDEAMRLLEARGNVKSFKELRQMVSDIDVDKNRKLSFLEWACAIYSKSWDVLWTPSIDPEEIAKAEKLQQEAIAYEAKQKALAEEAEKESNAKALEELKASEAKARADGDVDAAARFAEATRLENIRQAEALKKKHADEAAAKAKKAKEEAEKKASDLRKAGVAGMAAKFKYAASDTKDSTKDNKAEIDAGVARRKELKRQELEAIAKAKLAEEEKQKKDIEAAQAAKAAAEAKRVADIAAAAKTKAEQEAAEAAEQKKKTDEETAKAREGKEASLKELAIYEAKKKADEEEKKKVKDEADRKRQEGRSKLASKAGLWTNNSASQVVASVGAGGAKLSSTKTEEKTGLHQAQLLGQIKKGAVLQTTPGAKVKSEELTDDQKADYIADTMRRQSVANS